MRPTAHTFEQVNWQNVEQETRIGVLQEMVAILLNKMETDQRYIEHTGLICGEYHYDGTCEWQMQCDEPGCHREVNCGTPTPDGYRNTCSDHRPGRSR